MPRADFELWLARRYGANATAKARFSNVVRIESAYGALDDHFRRDRCSSIMQSLSYSGRDAAKKAPNPSRIPIFGDVYNGLGTLRNALALYIEFMSGMEPRETRRGQSSAPLLDRDRRSNNSRYSADSVIEAPSVHEMNSELEPKRDGILELLRRYASVKDELAKRGVIRTGNVVGEYGEWLFSKALAWQLSPPSEKHHDATDADGVRYQVKARREAGRSGSRQLGIMRNLTEDGWDQLAAVLFSHDFMVLMAVIIPRDVVAEQAIYSAYQKGHIVHLNKSLVEHRRTRDVTAALAAIQT